MKDSIRKFICLSVTIIGVFVIYGVPLDSTLEQSYGNLLISLRMILVTDGTITKKTSWRKWNKLYEITNEIKKWYSSDL